MTVPGVGRSGRDQRRQKMFTALVEALESLVISGEPYPTLSVERIAREAGVSRATFYIYFEGKPGLVQAWLDTVVDEFVAAATAWQQLGTGSALPEVRQALGELVSTYRRHARLLAAASVEASQDRPIREQLDQAVQAAVQGLSAQLRHGQAEGWVHPDLTLPEAAAWAVCLLERGLDGLPDELHEAEVHRFTDALSVLAWNALFAGASPRGGDRNVQPTDAA